MEATARNQSRGAVTVLRWGQDREQLRDPTPASTSNGVGSLQTPMDRTPLAGEHIQARGSLHKGQSPETPALGRSPSRARAEGRREQ